MNQNDYFRYLNIGLPQDIAFEKAIGHFAKAIELIDNRLLKEEVSEDLHASLVLQREIMKRIPYDYPYSFEEALCQMQRLIPDFTKEELQKCMDERRFSFVYINGQPAIFKRFMSVLVNYEDIACRVENYKKPELENWFRYKTVKEIKKNGKLQLCVTIRQTLKIKDESFKKSENYLVHLPIPTECDSQCDIRIIKASPMGYVVDDANSDSRSIYWKGQFSKNEEFSVEYSYLSSVTYTEFNKLSKASKMKSYLNEEEPHIIFSKLIKDTADALTKDISDPYEKAKAIYDYMTLNMKYSYQPSYFIMDNIPDNCLKTMRGDCGIFAITFITLLRYLGIPAYFESSKCLDEKEVGCHDWARFYIEPYGWLYADVSFGIGCRSHGFEEGRQFYFGNLDPYRMIANKGLELDLSGNKKYWRHDPYDHQLGEVEDGQKGYIANIDYTSEASIVSLEKC